MRGSLSLDELDAAEAPEVHAAPGGEAVPATHTHTHARTRTHTHAHTHTHTHTTHTHCPFSR